MGILSSKTSTKEVKRLVAVVDPAYFASHLSAPMTASGAGPNAAFPIFFFNFAAIRRKPSAFRRIPSHPLFQSSDLSNNSAGRWLGHSAAKRVSSDEEKEAPRSPVNFCNAFQ